MVDNTDSKTYTLLRGLHCIRELQFEDVKYETLKKKTENLWEINLGKMFLDVTPKAQFIKAKKKKRINWILAKF